MNEKKLGVIFSYVSLLASSVLSIILTPFMLRTMGDVEYGLYHTISSFIGVLTVLDFGAGISTTKYIAEFNLKKDRQGGNNYLGMALIVNGIISAIICLIGTGFVLSIKTVYGKTFTAEELSEASILAILYIANIIVTIFVNMFHGVVSGYKKFVFANSTHMLKIFFRFGLIFVLLSMGFSAIAISIADISSNLLVLLLTALYSVIKLKAYPKLVKWDKALFYASLFFSSALFIQAIVNQINNSIDRVLLGSMLGGTAVTIYSVAMNIYLIFGSLSGAIRKIMLPDAVKMIHEGADGKQITDFVIRGGRYQFIVLIYILCGFALVGKEFIRIWVGNSYETSYYIALILMVPTLFQLSQNITETILDAMGKRMMRSIILAIGAVSNAIITIIFIRFFGVIGAPIGTAISCVGAALIGLNIYHKKVISLQVKRMFVSICDRTLICAVLSMLISYTISFLMLSDVVSLLAKGFVFSALYFTSLMLWGFNQNEKAFVNRILHKLRLKRRYQ